MIVFVLYLFEEELDMLVGEEYWDSLKFWILLLRLRSCLNNFMFCFLSEFYKIK